MHFASSRTKEFIEMVFIITRLSWNYMSYTISMSIYIYNLNNKNIFYMEFNVNLTIITKT